MLIRSKLVKCLLAMLILMGIIQKCCAVQWGYVFVPTATAQAPAFISQVFANGLRPQGRPLGRNGIDFWNYLARPHTNPLFFMAYADWNAVRAASDSSILNGVLFQVALDDNFFKAEKVIESMRIALSASSGAVNNDIDRLLENVDLDWRRQRVATGIEPVVGITGFQGTHIIHTAVNSAWTVNAGQLQNGQTNAAYQSPTTQMRYDTATLFEAIGLYTISSVTAGT